MSPLNSSGRSQRGFALVITLSLVALLILVLLALTSLVKVNSKATDTTLAQAKARQNALLALEIAMAQLQKHAGPDTRVTATAEAFGAAGAKYFAGVWPSADLGKNAQTWLVSGSELAGATPAALLTAALDPAVAPTAAQVYLVGSNSVALNPTAPTASEMLSRVLLPKVPITADVLGFGPGTTVGNYAWWVGDQGTKAALNFTADTAPLTFITAEERDVARQLTPERMVGEAIFPALAGTTVAVQQNLQKVITQPQYAQVAGVTNLPNYFHAVTPATFGVLASTAASATGGLKSDLSIAPSLLPGVGFANVAAMGAMIAPTATQPYRRLYKITPPVTTGNGKVVDSVAPVLSQLAIGFGVYFSGSQANPGTQLILKIQFLAELWNPYTSELQGEDLEVEITGLPSVNVDYGSGSVIVPLQTNVAANPLVIKLPFPSSPVNPIFRFLPGRVLNWAGLAFGPDGKPTATVNSRTATVGLLTKNLQVVALAPPKNTVLNISSPGSTTLTVKLRMEGGGPILATYTSPSFNAVSSSAAAATAANIQFAYNFRLLDRVDFSLPPAKPGDWLTGQDPRETQIAALSMTPAVNIQPASNNTMAISQATSLLDRAASLGLGPVSISFGQDVPLFELPRQPYTSVGSLQHLQIQSARPFSIGNPWGAAAGYNAYFDQFFFSGATAPVLTAAGANFPAKLPNLRLRTYVPTGTVLPTTAQVQALTKARSPRYLMVDGAFNINSTSVDAWKSVLAGVTITDWPYVNLSTQDGAQDSTTPTKTLSAPTPLANAFFRFGQSGKETYLIPNPATNSITPAEKQFYRPGVRLLTNIQRDSLATTIVQNILAKHSDSGPFRTIEQFLAPSNAPQFGGGNIFAGKSLLEHAIANAVMPNGTPAINFNPAIVNPPPLPAGKLIDENSSSFLTQADIMTALAPFVAARSDTFLVRGYGEVVNPATGAVDSRAWCEALVQRLPEFLDSTSGQDPEIDFSFLSVTNGQFGRKFKIISLRWLNSSDI